MLPFSAMSRGTLTRTKSGQDAEIGDCYGAGRHSDKTLRFLYRRALCGVVLQIKSWSATVDENEPKRILFMSDQSQHPFTWRHFQSDLILLCLRWYLRSSLSYRDLEEMMLECGLHVDHTTMYRWASPMRLNLSNDVAPPVEPTTDSWRGDETYIKVKKQWGYLARAVDSQGNTLEFFFRTRQRMRMPHQIICLLLVRSACKKIFRCVTFFSLSTIYSPYTVI